MSEWDDLEMVTHLISDMVAHHNIVIYDYNSKFHYNFILKMSVPHQHPMILKMIFVLNEQ